MKTFVPRTVTMPCYSLLACYSPALVAVILCCAFG